MSRIIHRSNGYAIRYGKFERKTVRNPIHQLLNQYIKECDSIFKVPDVLASYRSYIDSITQILENKPIDQYIKKRPKISLPLEHDELPTRIYKIALPAIDKNMSLRAVSKSITHMDRSVQERKKSQGGRNNSERKNIKPRAKTYKYVARKPIIMNSIDRSDDKLHEKLHTMQTVYTPKRKKMLTVTVRRGWMTEYNYEQSEIEYFVRRL